MADKKAVKATVDFELKDNGHATATATPKDAVGLDAKLPDGAGVPTWVSSDPGVVVTPAADGLTADVAPSTPPVLVSGAVLTVSCLLADGVTTLTGTSDPIDVVASDAVGFAIAEA